jgi:SAM-dependent methyltransferase
MKPRNRWQSFMPGRAILALIVKVMCALSPERSLRLMFRLERWLYYFEGQVASAYEGGPHPKHRLTRYHDFFVSHVSPGERVLDLGCGVGAVACDLAQKANACVVGVDLDPDKIAQARRHHAHPQVEYHQGDVLANLPEGRFDVVVLSNVLEHLAGRSEFLRQLQQRVDPSRFLIRVPLFERDWRVPLKRELGVEWRLDPTHETEYTLESFDEEVKAAGLHVVHREVRWSEIWAVVSGEGRDDRAR